MDDAAILKMINNRKTKEQGFRLLVAQTKEQLYRQIRHMVGSHEDADDLLQEVYIKVFSKIGSLRQDSSLSTWISRIAYNETVNYIKSKSFRNSRSDISLDLTSIISSTMENRQINAEKIISALTDAVSKLPEKQKEVFNMRYYQNIPFKQMEQMLNTSESALKTSYHIAEKKIKDFLLNGGLNF